MNRKKKIEKVPPYIYGTSSGKLCLDTSHPEWIEYFTKFITENNERFKKFIK